MTDKEVQRTQYKYTLNSNLVIQGQSNQNRENEPSGEGETLTGRKLAPFGDKVQREKPPELTITFYHIYESKDQKQGKLSDLTHYFRKQDTKKKQDRDIMNSKRETQFSMASGSEKNILNAQIQEDLVYRPKTKETRAIYETILTIVQKHMGDNSLEVLRGATEEVIALLKTENINDSDKKKEIEGIIDRMSSETFNQLVVLSQQLVDYNPEDELRENQREQQIDVNFEAEDDEDAADDEDQLRQSFIEGLNLFKLEVKGQDEEAEDQEEKKEKQEDEDADLDEEDIEIQQKEASKNKDQLSFQDIDALQTYFILYIWHQ